MAEFVESYQRCGTEYPGYLGFAHPSAGEPPKYGDAYFRSSTNAKAYSIKVLVCACSYDGGASVSMSYKLPSPPGMPHHLGTSE